MITPEEFLNITKNNKTDKVFKLATIAEGYTDGKPRVIFDGESKQTAKKYAYLDSYKPVSGDRVLMAYVSGSYVILGKIN
jgi:hypothetical protein